MDSDLICALATSPAAAALAVVRTSGPGAVAAVAACTDRREAVAATPGGRVRTVILRDRVGSAVDEAVLTIWRAPHSYTGEEMVEITCHGSPVGVERVLDLLLAGGFRPAEPGEFTQRAFLNGRIDLTRAEAVHELVTSRSGVAHQLAMTRLTGSLFEAIDEVKRTLVGIMASVAIQVDYPDDEIGAVAVDASAIERARARLDTIAATWQSGSLYQHGCTVVLAGAVNAGKSSLFNALLRTDRAIVSATPGTTRDYLEAALVVGGVPVRLYDTAGLRDADEEIEGEGIRRTRALVDHADVVVEVVDGTDAGVAAAESGAADAPHAAADASVPPTIRVWNKTDDPACRPTPPDAVAVSAHTHVGIDALLDRLAEVLGQTTPPEPGAVVIESARQRSLLSRASAALGLVLEGLRSATPVDLIALDLQEALAALGELTGEVSSEDVLDAVFGAFCVGK